MGEGDLLALLIELLGGDFPLAAEADALEGVEVADIVVVASAFLALELRSTLPVVDDVCFWCF
jgi:hypothetical protein